MKLIELQKNLRERVGQAARERFGVDLENISAEVPPRTELGDLAFPVAFELAKRIKQATGEKRNPRAIADELKKDLEAVEFVARVEVAGAGYLNLFYDRARFLSGLNIDEGFAAEDASRQTQPAHKTIVEHTNINPNKAAHIGHLRNAVLGDTFVRTARAAGEQVEVENYIDNTGVQVADVVVGFIHIERLSLEDIRSLDASLPPERPFDYYCWDLYARVGLFYRNGDAEAKEDAEKIKLRSQTLHDIEHGTSPTAEIADYVATRIVNCHLDTMERLNIRYDVLPRESEILHFMWDKAFALLKDTGAIRLETDGKNKGCWVMPMETHTSTDEHEADKVIVRSNGTITYTGKDIGYQLWKLGQLGIDFNYKPFRKYDDGHTVWVTTSQTVETGDAFIKPHFGGGQKVYNVIDSRQSYTQDVVRKGVAAVAPDIGIDSSVHLAYEMVALSPAACEELGLTLSEEDRARPFIEMSGRRGLGVKADDLIDRLEERALVEVKSRHAELDEASQKETARIIAVGALRYFLLKWTRNSIIAFDFQEAISFEGETGPYCQYAAVRANSIFRKLDGSALDNAKETIRASSQTPESTDALSKIFEGEAGDELWSLVTLAARLDEVVRQAATAAEPANLAKYAFQLARAFNLFYHRHRIIAEEDALRRATLVCIADFVRRQLTSALQILGITVPERM